MKVSWAAYKEKVSSSAAGGQKKRRINMGLNCGRNGVPAAKTRRPEGDPPPTPPELAAFLENARAKELVLLVSFTIRGPTIILPPLSPYTK